MKNFILIILTITLLFTNTYGEVVDHSNMLPLPCDQGEQGSCTAWAVAYAKTYYEVKEWNISPVHIFMSPSFIFNQLNNGKNKGIYIDDALQLLNNVGCLPNKEFPYDVFDYLTKPNDNELKRASLFKNKSYYSFDIETNEDIERAKKLLKDNVLITSIPIYPDCRNLDWNNRIYDIKEGESEGNHSICITGYDDDLQSFIFINSWSRDYGLNGYGYISYDLVWILEPTFYRMIDDTCSPSEKLMSGLLKWQIGW